MTAASPRRRHAIAALAAGAVLSLSGLTGIVAALAQTPVENPFGGIVLESQGSGMRWIYRNPQAPVPAENSAEMSSPYTEAVLNTGPAGHGLASGAWPGATAANACAAAPVPCYPVRAETFSPQGPADASNTDTPGVAMTSHADGYAVTADASQQDAIGPPGVTTGNLSSSSSSAVADGAAVSHTVSRAADIAIGDAGAGVPLVAIQEVLSDVQASTDGATATVTGGTTVTGVTVAGRPARVDQDGIHVGDENQPSPIDQIIDDAARDALAQAGIQLYTAAPVTTVNGAAGEISTGGLLIVFDAGSTYANLLPEDFRSQNPADPSQAFIVVLAEAGAKVDAVPPVSFSSPAPVSTPAAPTPLPAPVTPQLGSTPGASPAAAPPSSAQPPAAAQAVATEPAAFGLPAGSGVFWLLVVLALGGAGVGGWGLRLLSAEVLDPGPRTDCLLQRTP